MIPAFRWILVPFVGLALGATWSLLVLPGRTEDLFAWTIEPTLTAALLGAAYGGTLVFFVLALREPVWANMRIVIPAPFVLSTLMLIATAVHEDRFHLRDAALVPTGVAWIWTVVYVVVPPALLVLFVVQLRAPGIDPPRTAPMPSWLVVLMGAYGVASVVGGLVLFVAPEEVVPHWPWTITALTGRALAAWIVALGVAALQGLVERDLRRVRIGLVAFTIIGGLGLLQLVRFHDQVSWDLGGWLVAAYLLVMAVAGGVGWRLSVARADADLSTSP